MNTINVPLLHFEWTLHGFSFSILEVLCWISGPMGFSGNGEKNIGVLSRIRGSHWSGYEGFYLLYITPRSPLKVNRRKCRLHLQGRRIRETRKHHEARSKQSVNNIFIVRPSVKFEWVPTQLRVHDVSTKVSALRPTILIDVSCSFRKTLQSSSGIARKIRPRPLHST
jgi:hypothetical protein